MNKLIFQYNDKFLRLRECDGVQPYADRFCNYPKHQYNVSLPCLARRWRC